MSDVEEDSFYEATGGMDLVGVAPNNSIAAINRRIGPLAAGVSSRLNRLEAQHAADMDEIKGIYGIYKEAKGVTDNKRLEDLLLNLHKYRGPGVTQTKQEQRVQAVFPDTFLASDTRELGVCEAKHKTRLTQALMPYELRPKRVMIELAGDFQQVALFICNYNTTATWMDFLEAVIQVLGSYNALHSPLMIFVGLLPAQDKAYVSFLWRLREAFYSLPGGTRNTQQTRDVIIDKLNVYTPSIWLNSERFSADWNTGQVIEEAVRVPGMITMTSIELKIYSTPEVTVQPQSTTVPYHRYNIAGGTSAKLASGQVQPVDHT
ncbi:hypothetical protein CHU98_g296 [Xylaria longipes]|nr:hypothetical protein CHU98_g296 [Xylaria longipes]